jgi:hypothetical protein
LTLAAGAGTLEAAATAPATFADQPMRELALTLYAMNAWQLALALVFVAGYGLALGALFELRARLWSAGIASAAAVGFVLLAHERVPALLLVAAVVGLFAVLIGFSWLVAWVSDRALPASGDGASTFAASQAPADTAVHLPLDRSGMHWDPDLPAASQPAALGLLPELTHAVPGVAVPGVATAAPAGASASRPPGSPGPRPVSPA